MAGVLEYVASDGEPRLLAMLQAYVANQGDGWTFSLEYLRRHLEQYRTTPASDALPANAHEGVSAADPGLGQRTAELHRRWRDPPRMPRFRRCRSPATTSTTIASVPWKRPATRSICWQRSRDSVPAADRERAGAVLAQRDRIAERIEACAADTPQGMKIRIHGDYHLGQVLVTRNDFVIIDFEGEPGHSLEQRRAKHSPLRDVAGMLRSFGYVQQSALRKRRAQRGRGGEIGAAGASLGARGTRTAFLAAYDAAARGAALYESRCNPGSGLLGLFELEKALYELRYELGNRPSWAGIPLQGILDWGGETGGSHAKH